MDIVDEILVPEDQEFYRQWCLPEERSFFIEVLPMTADGLKNKMISVVISFKPYLQ